jgi:GNAT superfamily N-acetyltransferase
VSSASATIGAMGVVVRRPTLDDVDELARINIDTWRTAYAGIVPQARINQMDPATYRQRWVDTVSLTRPGVGVFVADIDGRPAAYAVGGPYRPQEDAAPEVVDGLGELFAIYVDPPMQSKGAGVAVHDALLGWLGEQGYTEAALWVLVANETARSWYARRGWRADGARSLWVAAGQALPELRLRRSLLSSRPANQTLSRPNGTLPSSSPRLEG